MPKYVSVITDKGRALTAKVLANPMIISFPRIGMGSGSWSSTEEMESATSLKTEMFSMPTTGKRVLTTYTAQIWGQLDTTEVPEEFVCREAALYAIDPDDGEIVYAIARETSGGDLIPSGNFQTVIRRNFEFLIQFANTEYIYINIIDPDLDKIIEDIIAAKLKNLGLKDREETIVATEGQSEFTLQVCNAYGIIFVFVSGTYNSRINAEWIPVDATHIQLGTHVSEGQIVYVRELLLGDGGGSEPEEPGEPEIPSETDTINGIEADTINTIEFPVKIKGEHGIHTHETLDPDSGDVDIEINMDDAMTYQIGAAQYVTKEGIIAGRGINKVISPFEARNYIIDWLNGDLTLEGDDDDVRIPDYANIGTTNILTTAVTGGQSGVASADGYIKCQNIVTSGNARLRILVDSQIIYDESTTVGLQSINIIPVHTGQTIQVDNGGGTVSNGSVITGYFIPPLPSTAGMKAPDYANTSSTDQFANSVTSWTVAADGYIKVIMSNGTLSIDGGAALQGPTVTVIPVTAGQVISRLDASYVMNIYFIPPLP